MFTYLDFHTFFSSVQESEWYTSFLFPVVEAITPGEQVLDVGTGSGKLLQLLALERNIRATGTDTSPAMLREANIKLGSVPADLIQTAPGEPWPLPSRSFDTVTICNVLFLLPERERRQVMNEAIRVLKCGGKILLLSPSGHGGMPKLMRYYSQRRNRSMLIWYLATRRRAGVWHRMEWTERFSQTSGFSYSRSEILNGFAILETIDLKKNQVNP